jgi:hypothetical protein
MSIFYSKENVFRTFNVSHVIQWRALSNYSRRQHNNSTVAENLDCHFVVTSQKIREMRRILKEDEFEAQALIWEQLDYEIELECSDQIISNAMSNMNYHKCVVCRKWWVSEKTARRRVEWVTVMLERYSDKTNWYRVRFSGEVHFEWDSQDKLFVIRQSSKRYCQDCIQHVDESYSKDVKRHRRWMIVSHNFKLDIHFYQISSNVNEKMN